MARLPAHRQLTPRTRSSLDCGACCGLRTGQARRDHAAASLGAAFYPVRGLWTDLAGAPLRETGEWIADVAEKA